LTASLKSQFLRFFGKREAHFKFHLSNAQKALPWPEQRIERGVSPKMRPLGVAKKRKKRQKLAYVKLAICPAHLVDVTP